MSESCGAGQRARISGKWHHMFVATLMITLWVSNVAASNGMSDTNVEQLNSKHHHQHSISSEEYVTDSNEDSYSAVESGETVIVPVEDADEGKFITR